MHTTGTATDVFLHDMLAVPMCAVQRGDTCSQDVPVARDYAANQAYTGHSETLW